MNAKGAGGRPIKKHLLQSSPVKVTKRSIPHSADDFCTSFLRKFGGGAQGLNHAPEYTWAFTFDAWVVGSLSMIKLKQLFSYTRECGSA